MAIQKLDEIDIQALDEAEYEEFEGYEEYTGDIPSTGTILGGHVSKMWLTYTKEDVPMLVVLTVADGDDEYYGLPTWDRIVLQESAAFRYKPFLAATGLTIKAIAGGGLDLADEDDNIGAPIVKIGKWLPGGNATVRYVVKKARFNGEWKAEIKTYLAPESANGHGKPAANKPASARGRSRRATTDAEDEAADARDEEEEKPARGARGARKPAAAKSAPARRGRRAATDDGDEPPF
jgi:hypothetical protein